MSQQPECISEFLSDFYSSACKKLWEMLGTRGVTDADLNTLVLERLRAIAEIVL